VAPFGDFGSGAINPLAPRPHATPLVFKKFQKSGNAVKIIVRNAMKMTWPTPTRFNVGMERKHDG